MICVKMNYQLSFRNYLFSLLIWTHNMLYFCSVHLQYDSMCNVGKYHTCYSSIFYFTLHNIDSASDAAFASILSSISSNWNNSFQIFSHHQFVVYLNFIYQPVVKSEVLCFLQLDGPVEMCQEEYEMMAI